MNCPGCGRSAIVGRMSTAPNNQDPWTVERLLTWTRGFFQQHEVDSPRLSAEILLAHAMGCARIELYTRYQTVPNESVLAGFRQAVKESAAGKPIAYLTMVKEFFSLEFEVTPDVLIPRPETEVLVERVIHLERHGVAEIKSILDIGTGSGCIAISLAKNMPVASLFASDISTAALEVAARNAERHQLSERITFATGDLFEPWESSRRFDVIVSNPPYVAQVEADDLPVNVRDYEPHAALFAGPDGLDILRRLIAEAPRHLSAGGHFLTEVAYNQADAVRQLLDETIWRDIVTYQDGLGHQRVVHARLRQPTPSSTT